jgi:hypothetical protein
VKRTLAATAVLVASLALAAPASAAPELFVRMQPWNDSEPVSDWIPLASTPSLDYLAGYQIGYKLQSASESAQLTVTGVPDGTPTQPYNDPPDCEPQLGTPGDIVTIGSQLQFEGDGTYTVSVSVGCGSPSSTGSFTVTTMVAPLLVGQPFSFRAKPLSGNQFVGVHADDPPGGFGEVRCTLGKATVPHPDDSEKSVSEDDFPRPGAWSCVARGLADGVDENFDRLEFGTPFSAPIPVEVRSDFRRRLGKVSKPQSRRPLLTLKAEWPAMSNGGHVKLTVSSVRGCRHHKYKLRRFGTFHAAFGAKVAHMRIRRPRADGYYLGRVAFSGTHFIRASVDPNPMYLQVSFGRLGFASTFPGC